MKHFWGSHNLKRCKECSQQTGLNSIPWRGLESQKKRRACTYRAHTSLNKSCRITLLHPCKTQFMQISALNVTSTTCTRTEWKRQSFKPTEAQSKVQNVCDCFCFWVKAPGPTYGVKMCAFIFLWFAWDKINCQITHAVRVHYKMNPWTCKHLCTLSWRLVERCFP